MINNPVLPKYFMIMLDLFVQAWYNYLINNKEVIVCSNTIANITNGIFPVQTYHSNAVNANPKKDGVNISESTTKNLNIETLKDNS